MRKIIAIIASSFIISNVEARFIDKEFINPSVHYFDNRYYSHTLGRFLTQDTKKAIASEYGYVNGNPIVESDPTGLMPLREIDEIFINERGIVVDMNQRELSHKELVKHITNVNHNEAINNINHHHTREPIVPVRGSYKPLITDYTLGEAYKPESRLSSIRNKPKSLRVTVPIKVMDGFRPRLVNINMDMIPEKYTTKNFIHEYENEPNRHVTESSLDRHALPAMNDLYHEFDMEKRVTDREWGRLNNPGYSLRNPNIDETMTGYHARGFSRHLIGEQQTTINGEIHFFKEIDFSK